MSKNRAKSSQIQKIRERTQKDMDEIGVMPRFGYFSIPCNNTIGDGFYSQEKKYNHKVVDRRVITERRGIYASGTKTGKGPDAYFQLMDTTDEKTQERLKEGQRKDYNDLMFKVHKRKEGKFVTPFKPPGAQKYKDQFDQHPFKRNYPLTKEKPKRYKIIDHKVITERRGIYTQPSKKGLYNTPNVLFSFTPFGYDKNEKFDFSFFKKKPKRPQTSIPSQTAYRKAFFPASIKKNECFSSIRETYGYDDKYYNKLKEKSNRQRKSPNQRYHKNLPSNAAKHMRPFTPASLSKQGRDGLFNKDIWNCPSVPEKVVIVNQREKKEYEAAHRKEPFKYNKTQQQTKPTPSVISNKLNMKKDFPTVYKS